jgi:LemA protein
MILILGVIFASVILWAVISFNAFIKEKNLIKEAWSGIDVQLKRRYDLIGNLIETVKGYVRYEKKVLENVSKIRSQAVNVSGVKEREEKENAVSRSVKTIFAIAEGYPQLRADKSFLNLQSNLVDTEDQIQLARRYYNGTVRNFNTRIESFPSMLIAKIFSFEQADFFEIEYATERKATDVKL